MKIIFVVIFVGIVAFTSENSENNLDLINLKLNSDKFWRLVAEVNYKETRSDYKKTVRLISNHFESVTFLPEKNYKDSYMFRENLKKQNPSPKHKFTNNYFIPSDTLRISNSNRYVVPMHGYGFESIPYIFSIFTVKDSNYYFEGILDSVFFVSIGAIGIQEIVTLQNGRNMMICESGGGDAGEEWNSLWLASFDDSCKIQVHKSFNYGYGYGKDQKKIEYSLSLDSLEVFVCESKRSVVSKIEEHFEYTDWVQSSCDTIKINSLVNKVE